MQKLEIYLFSFAVDPSKLNILQELPEVGKVVIQETRSMEDPISSILQEMKTGMPSYGEWIRI